MKFLFTLLSFSPLLAFGQDFSKKEIWVGSDTIEVVRSSSALCSGSALLQEVEQSLDHYLEDVRNDRAFNLKPTIDKINYISRSCADFPTDAYLNEVAFLKAMISKGRGITITSNRPQPIWESMNTDSAEFVKVYGTPEEWSMQEDLRLASKKNYAYPVVLGSMKFYWYNQLGTFIQGLGYSDEGMTAKDGLINIKYKENGIASGREFYNIRVRAVLDQDDRMQKITITGDADPLINIFVKYWNTNYSVEQLKGKQTVSRRFYSDQVTWSWTDRQPTITITQAK